MQLKKEPFKVTCFLRDFAEGEAGPVRGQEEEFDRIGQFPISLDEYILLKPYVKHIGVTENFRSIIRCFKPNPGETPAGFRAEYSLEPDGCLTVDLKRDIGYGKNSVKRATGMLFSADCADPYKIRSFKNVLANVTTNPAIIYDRFINDETANIGHRFTTREQVMRELSDILGPGVDISVELNNPFASEQEILEEIAEFKEILTPYRLVVKVPHLGPVSAKNMGQLLDGTFQTRYNDAKAEDACRSHDLAVMLREHGCRVNFTLMAESHQTAMALQVKPAYINTFMRNRYHHNEKIDNLLKCFKATEDESCLKALRTYLIEHYYLSANDAGLNLFEVKRMGEWLLSYHGWHTDGADGLDQARHSLRELKYSNLPDTRLIICSLDGEMYSMVDKMLMEEEFCDMADRVVISAAPDYLAGFTSSPAVLEYNKSFISAALSAES